MNQTGVASTGSERQALMNRVGASVSVHREQRAREAHEVLEPHRLEAQLGAELPQLVRYRVVEEVVARDDRHRRVAMLGLRSELAQEPEAVDERHPEIK